MAIAEKIQAQAIVEKYRKHILIPEDASKMQIQEACFAFANIRLMDVLTKKEQTVVDDATYEDGGNRGAVLIIFGILFRDAFLKERGFEVPQPKEEGETEQNP